MSLSPLNRLRRLWFSVHLWAGVGLFILLVPLALSGAATVWRPELDRIVHAERYRISDNPAVLGPSALLASAAKALGPNLKPVRIAWPETAGAPVTVTAFPPAATGQRPRPVSVWLDPASGQALSRGAPMDGFAGLMHDFHENLLVPGAGRLIVGVLGVFMLIQSLTGVWLWWPRGGGFLAGFRFRRSPFLEMKLHHLVGFWVSIPLAVVSATGVWMAFEREGPPRGAPPFAAGRPGPQGGFAGGPGPGGGGFRGGGFFRRLGQPLVSPHLTADEALSRAQDQEPNSRVVSLLVPMQTPEPSWTVQLQPVGAERPNTVRISDDTGEASEGFGGFGGFGGFRGPPGGFRPDPVAQWTRRLHTGEDVTPVWRVIITLAGIAPLLLALTGVIRWLSDFKRPRPDQISQTEPA